MDNKLLLRLSDGLQIRANADSGTSFFALVRLYLKAAYYTGFSSSSLVLQIAGLV